MPLRPRTNGLIPALDTCERSMPSMSALTRIARIATMPETRRLVTGAARSETLRDIVHRAAREPDVLAREMRDPAVVRELFRTTLHHPATHEIGSLGLLFVPGRYLPIGWVATWAARRFLRRYARPPAETADPRASSARPAQKNVTPPGR
jgi:hypothetical protein